MKNNILLVEDNASFRLFVKEALKNLANIFEAANINYAKKIINEKQFDIVLLDINLPDGKGIDIIEYIKEHQEENVNIIILTAYGDIPLAIESIKKGALDFWQKPIEYKEIIDKVSRLLNNKSEDYRIEEIIIGESENVKQIRKQVLEIARTDVNVLITGPIGSGKELIANAIHKFSGRTGNFSIIDFSLIKEDLFETELFGNVKGAFSGAFESKIGKIEYGDDGTLFFDNLQELNIQLQGKLLRFVDSKRFYPVGSNKEKHVNVRIITSLQNNITKLLEESVFRKDLFFRLNVYPINILPLKERSDDIVPLAKHFINVFQKEHKKEINLNDDFYNALLYYDWPGNIRELMNVLERIVITENTSIINEFIKNKTSEGLKEKIKALKIDFEKKEIVNTLKITNGNKTEAAKILKISYKHLLEKIKEYKIE